MKRKKSKAKGKDVRREKINTESCEAERAAETHRNNLIICYKSLDMTLIGKTAAHCHCLRNRRKERKIRRHM